MKILKKIFLSVLILAVLFFAGLSLFLKAKGKEILTRELSRALGVPVQLGEARLVFAPPGTWFVFSPGLRFENVEIPPWVKAGAVNVYLSASVLSGGRVNILKIILHEPVFVLERKKKGATVSSEDAGNAAQPGLQGLGPQGPYSASVPGRSIEKTKIRGVFIKELQIMKGQLRLTQAGGEQGSLKGNVEQIDLRARALSFPPKAGNTTFSVKAKLGVEGWSLPKGDIQAQGTADFFMKNMDAVVTIKDTDEHPGLSAQVKSVNNDVTVTGKIDAGWLLSGVAAKNSDSAGIGSLVAGALKIALVSVPVDFSFKTKMDDFRFDAVAFSGVVDYEGKKDDTSGENVRQDLKSIGKEFEALGRKFYEENIKTPVNAVP